MEKTVASGELGKHKNKFLKTLRFKNRSPNTIRMYETAVRLFMNEYNPFDVTKDEIMDYILDMERKNATKRFHLSVLSTFYTWLVREGLIKKENNPMLDMEKIEPDFYQAKGLEKEEALRILKLGKDVLETSITAFLMGTGVRVNECSHMLTKNVKLETKLVNVVKEDWQKDFRLKRGRERETWIFSWSLPYLIEYMKIRKKSKYFFNVNGKRISDRTIYNMVRRVGEQSGLKDEHLYPHKCRSTFVQISIDMGISDSVITAAAGWRKKNGELNIGMMSRYSSSKLSKSIKRTAETV